MDLPLDFSQHPCFNVKVRHSAMRIHLPVAPRCNVQCKFCTRLFDCVNESRPGVTQAVLSPEQALHYLEEQVVAHPQIKVVGIAGPGDPFANPDETMETLRLVRKRFPEMLLCLATNGLNLLPYIPELAALKVSHVSITVNGVRPEIVEKVYSWVRFGKTVLMKRDAANKIIECQLSAIAALKAAGILIKINTVVIAGVNDDHVMEIAETVKKLGADILNPMAMYANKDAPLGKEHVPLPERVAEIKLFVGSILNVMHHCTRCRADAVGLLGAGENTQDQLALKSASEWTGGGITPVSEPQQINGDPRPFIAVATREGLLVDQHLGEAQVVWVFRTEGEELRLVGKRKAPSSGSGDARWEELGKTLKDCSSLLVSGIGARPKTVLSESGISVYQVEGIIQDIIPKLQKNESVASYQVASKKCGEACRGNGTGCG